MKIKDLIEELSNFDGDKNVIIAVPCFGTTGSEYDCESGFTIEPDPDHFGIIVLPDGVGG